MLGVRAFATSSDATFSMHASPRMARLLPAMAALRNFRVSSTLEAAETGTFLRPRANCPARASRL